MFDNVINQLRNEYPDMHWVKISETKNVVYMLSDKGTFVSVSANKYKIKKSYLKDGIEFISYQNENGECIKRSLPKLLKIHFTPNCQKKPVKQKLCTKGETTEERLRKDFPENRFAEFSHSKYIRYFISDNGRIFAARSSGYKELIPWIKRGKPYITFFQNGKSCNRAVYALINKYFEDKPYDIEYLDGEIWKAIPQHPDYFISNYGRVKSNKKGVPHLIKGRSCINGHSYVTLCKDRTSKLESVAHLVADAFSNNPEQIKYLYHTDKDLNNNRIDNLQPITETQHMSNMGKQSSREKCIKLHCIENDTTYSSMKEAAKALGLPIQHVSLAVRWNATIDGKYTFEVIEAPLRKRLLTTKIKCNETGEVYHSFNAAAKALGISAKQVSYATHNGTKVNNIYSFTEVK